MTLTQTWTRLAVALGMAVLIACAKGDQAGQQSADSTARDLTLAPIDSTAALHDVPAPPPPQAAPTTPPPSRPPTAKPRPTPPAAPAPAVPATRTAAAGTFLDLAVGDSLSSKFTTAGDHFTAAVVEDVKDAQGRVVIPAGSTVHGSVVEVKAAPNPSTPGTMTLALNSVTVGGRDYPIEARIDSIETVRQGRGVSGGDAAKVGGGAAAGAILGRVIGKNTKGAVIGGILGGIVGAGVAVQSKDVDIVLPKGAHINASLAAPLTVRVS
jgi:hypothetical protein